MASIALFHCQEKEAIDMSQNAEQKYLNEVAISFRRGAEQIINSVTDLDELVYMSNQKDCAARMLLDPMPPLTLFRRADMIGIGGDYQDYRRFIAEAALDETIFAAAKLNSKSVLPKPCISWPRH